MRQHGGEEVQQREEILQGSMCSWKIEVMGMR
jgi:hypothetical protein